jgi:cytochrome P450
MGLVSAFAILLTSLTLTLVLPILTHRTKLHLASLRRACASPPLRPSSDPLFGLDILFTNINYLKTNQRVKQWHNSFRQYGATYGFYLFGKRTIATIDARNVQFVLATEFEKFGVGPGRLKGSLPMVGRGVINTDGEVWRKGRDLIMPVFSRSQIANREMFERHFAKFLERLQGCGDETVDLKPMFDELVCTEGSIWRGGRLLTFAMVDS